LIALCVAICLPGGAALAADAGSPWLFVDPGLGDSLAKAALAAGGTAAQSGGTAIGEACDQRLGVAPRLVLLSRLPTSAEVEDCRAATDADLATILVGRRAIALVAPAASPVFGLAAADLYAAFGLRTRSGRAPAFWSELNPSYPNLPIALLVPAAGSDARRLFEARLIAPACAADDGDNPANCGALRSDQPILERSGDWQEVAKWAASAPLGELGVVTAGELRHLDQVVVPLPLDGALPTAANIDNGRYPAAAELQLLIVLPNGMGDAARDAAWWVAFDLLAEASIGPDGALAEAGLVPLPADQRAAARVQAHDFLAAH
jgi:phosphate transport system substrate-binding protein